MGVRILWDFCRIPSRFYPVRQVFVRIPYCLTRHGAAVHMTLLRKVVDIYH